MKSEINTLIQQVLANTPEDWLEMTTHRLDIYNESRAKTEFLEEFENLVATGSVSKAELNQLPTAYDYVRLGHQLSSVLEWTLATRNDLKSEQVIAFSSPMMALMAIMRTDATRNRATRIYSDGDFFSSLDFGTLERVYLYKGSLQQMSSPKEVEENPETSNVYVTGGSFSEPVSHDSQSDFVIKVSPHFGCALFIMNSKNNEKYGTEKLVKALQHVRRRETIATTPLESYVLLKETVGLPGDAPVSVCAEEKDVIYKCIQTNSGSDLTPGVASSGLSVQYAILMGFIDKARREYPDKPIKLVLPPNCYGGTNDQARRIAEIDPKVEVVDIPVDGDQDMVVSLEGALDQLAREDAIGIVMAEIPTNPRVEVPNMENLGDVLRAERKTPAGTRAQPVVFVVDQTFCPNVPVLHKTSPLREVQTVSFVSCSKFPSGGKCTGGYVTANEDASELLGSIVHHLNLTGNGATNHQWNTLAEQMPSMNERIKTAYNNTGAFVAHVRSVLPTAKLNFVSDEVASLGFTPSVFSLELPTTGNTIEDREKRRRELNQKLISHIITAAPDDAKHCVSYGQLKGSYWTIPATSTQGTTDESAKDYIIRVALSPRVDLERLQAAFTEFFESNSL